MLLSGHQKIKINYFYRFIMALMIIKLDTSVQFGESWSVFLDFELKFMAKLAGKRFFVFLLCKTFFAFPELDLLIVSFSIAETIIMIS
jgi:hypothetical protein